MFLFVLVGLGVTWALSGGPERAQEKESTRVSQEKVAEQHLVNTNATLGTNTNRNINENGIGREIERVQNELEEVQKELENIKTLGEQSLFKDKITIENSTGGLRKTHPDDEYFILRAQHGNEKPISITGWKIESTITGKKRTIGNGSHLPNSGGVSLERNIQLSPGDRAFIITGRSPIGISFRTNICTGYFEQYQNFTPYLKKECPRAKNELEEFSSVSITDDGCYNFVSRIPRCKMVISQTPLLSPSCSQFLSNHANYNGCVSNHRDDNNFYKPEWRVYLGRSSEQWREKREVLRLLDTEGRVVDVFTY